MEHLTLHPIEKISGIVNLPGSKSISNRALVLAALAEGTTKLTNLLDSDDTKHMLTALTQFGVEYQLSHDKTECTVQGLGKPFNCSTSLEVLLGNSGTSMRTLAAILCLGEGEYILTGDPRMKERPIGHLVDALDQAGANIEYLENENYPPLKISGTGLVGGNVSIDGSISSQFLTAILMALPLAKNDTTIEILGDLVSKPYIDITIQLMKRFGVEVENRNYQQFIIKSGQKYISPGNVLVEGDASSASYFLAAAAVKGGEVQVTGIGKHSIQGDIQFADALEKMGAVIEWGDDYIKCRRNDLVGIDIDCNHIPDAAMSLAIIALFAKGPTTIRNIYNWRVKETDRLAAVTAELRKVGANVEEGHDYIIVESINDLQHAEIDTYDDHRIAMCFSLIALSGTAVTINDPKCTSKTFPDYFDKLKSLCQ
ncbi:3-phosphoshikimate 1-carboxyvinyltransferase [Photobacterium makurazakiensis]|uniref:3-phosphoshikimate 1-carboxyvinyltransferase n=1 Tax=Photobacterium makurazakiensis TaxID=2910234 RepID=UPI003D130C18